MNIADIMLNKRIDRLVEICRAQESAIYNFSGTDEWFAQTDAKKAKLFDQVKRGLARCYPNMSDDDRSRMLSHILAVR